MTVFSRQVCVRLAIAFSAIGTASPMRAGLIGSSVNGSLIFTGDPNNYFDPSIGIGVVLPEWGNAVSTNVVIGGGVEFGFLTRTNRDTADFSDFGLLVTDLTMQGTNPWRMTFINSAFIGLNLMEESDTFPTAAGLSASLVGTALVIEFPGSASPNPTTWSAQYSFVPSGIPDGGTSVCLLALALSCFAGMRRLRRNS